LTDEEKKELMTIIRGASEEALGQIRTKEVDTGKSSKEKFDFFAAIVRQALDETEEELLSEDDDDCDCENCAFRDKCGKPEEVDLELNAMLVLMANEAAKEEGKTLSQWLTELIVKELFY